MHASDQGQSKHFGLRGVQIVSLGLDGNPALQQGYSRQVYRANVILLLPDVWVLDGVYVTQAERAAAERALVAEPEKSAGIKDMLKKYCEEQDQSVT